MFELILQHSNSLPVIRCILHSQIETYFSQQSDKKFRCCACRKAQQLSRVLPSSLVHAHRRLFSQFTKLNLPSASPRSLDNAHLHLPLIPSPNPLLLQLTLHFLHPFHTHPTRSHFRRKRFPHDETSTSTPLQVFFFLLWSSAKK